MFSKPKPQPAPEPTVPQKKFRKLTFSVGELAFYAEEGMKLEEVFNELRAKLIAVDPRFHSFAFRRYCVEDHSNYEKYQKGL